jgi:hypothetical protein
MNLHKKFQTKCVDFLLNIIGIYKFACFCDVSMPLMVLSYMLLQSFYMNASVLAYFLELSCQSISCDKSLGFLLLISKLL